MILLFYYKVFIYKTKLIKNQDFMKIAWNFLFKLL